MLSAEHLRARPTPALHPAPHLAAVAAPLQVDATSEPDLWSRILPWAGLPLEGLHDIGSERASAAALGFAAAWAGRALRHNHDADRRHILWCRPRALALSEGRVHGLGLKRFGLDPSSLLFAEAASSADLLWAMEEGLRSGRFSAVIGEAAAPDLTASRRLQLASRSTAHRGGTLALLLTPLTHLFKPSSAMTRWEILSSPAAPATDCTRNDNPCWQAELRRCRGGQPGRWLLEWNDVTLCFSLAAPLANRSLAAAG